MNVTDDDDISIPAFLLVKNRGKVKPKKTKGNPPAPIKREEDFTQTILESLDEKLRATLESEMRAGRFRRHWLLDRGSIALFEQSLMDKQRKKEEGLARLAAIPREVKPPKPVFGVGLYIKTISENPRKEGTGAWKRYNEMTAYVKKNPKADVADVLRETSYRADDFGWDVARKSVTTDVKPQEKKK